ncbi:MAG TPA: hypothetical protein DF427_01270 [Moraxellaceae bacterium]|nr:hypothetical protein [Moraxellaceae bacterium]
MLATLGSERMFEDREFIMSQMGRRHASYGVIKGHVPALEMALMATVERFDGEVTLRALDAWKRVLGEYLRLMSESLPELSSMGGVVEAAVGDSRTSTLLDDVGGEAVVEAVHRRFYREVFDDPWIGIFFYGKSIDSLVMKQTKFMVAAFGGGDDYKWEAPDVAHLHMYITDEQADIREIILRNAIREQGLSASVEERWLATDQSFRSAIVKTSIESCRVRGPGQVPLAARRPEGYRVPVLLPRD